MTDQQAFLSIPAAAEKCGVDRRTMWRWVKSRKVPSFVTPGGHHRITSTDVDRLLGQSRLSPAGQPKQKTILIVDDDAQVRELLKRRLRRRQFCVETAADGFSAGMRVRERRPDLIILDLIMEGVDGFEVCRKIKTDPYLKDTRILIMTGFDTPAHRTRAMREGADGYVAKHADFSILLAYIEALLENREETARQ